MKKIPSFLHTIKLPMPAAMGTVNCYLIRGPKGCALVDTGLDDGSSCESLDQSLEQHHLSSRDIETVVCTHHHIDHAGLGKTFQDMGVRVYMTKGEALMLSEFFAKRDSDRDTVAFFGQHEIPEYLIDSVAAIFPFLRKLGVLFEPDVGLEDGDIVELGGIPFEVLLTPGHSPGHICLLQPDEKILLTGDCVMTPQTTHISPQPAADEKTDHIEMFLNSLNRLQGLGPLTALPGHGRMIPDVRSRAAQVEAHLRKEIQRVYEALSPSPKTAYALLPKQEGIRVRPFPEWLALTQTVIYLNHLVLTEKAKSEHSDKGLTYRISN